MAEKVPPVSNITTLPAQQSSNGVATTFPQSKANSAAHPPGASAMVNLAKIASSGTNSNMQIINTPVRPKTAQTLRPVAPGTSQLRPLQGATIALPAGLNLPPGTVLMQNEKGQLVIVSRPNQQQTQMRPNLNQPNQQKPQQLRPNSVPIVAAQTGAVTSSSNRASQILPQQKIVASRSKTNVINSPGAAALSSTSTKPIVIGDDVRKCKNFLETLLRLSSQQPPETYKNVQKLIQGLLDASVAPEDFTDKLQKELKSQKQPGLAPFLKKSLPDLRKVVRARQLSITGLTDEWIVKLQQQEKDVKPPIPVSVPLQTAPSLPSITTKTPPVRKQVLSPNVPPISIQQRSTVNSPLASTSGLNKSSIPSSTSTSHHSINTQPKVALNKVNMQPKVALTKAEMLAPSAVGAMLNTTSVKGSTSAMSLQRLESQYPRPEIQNTLLQIPVLHQKLNSMLFRKGIRQMSSDVLKVVSDSCQERLRHVISETVVAAEHRLEIYRTNPQFKPTDDVRSKIKFLESLEKLEKKRKDELEREALLRVAKSRTKAEDPEQAKLKQKAKEMQQAEYEVARQRDANLTALAAIGPRKRKQFDITGAGSSTAGSAADASTSSANQDSNTPPAPTRARLKRLNLRDVQYVTEQDKYLYKSTMLYKSHVR